MRKETHIKRVISLLVISVLLCACFCGCTTEKTAERVGYPVVKVTFPEGSDNSHAFWDYNKDGVTDEFTVFSIGSGESNESLYYVDGKTGESEELCRGRNTGMSIGFAEGDDSQLIIFDISRSLFFDGAKILYVEPLAEIKPENGKPVVVAVTQSGEDLPNYEDFENYTSGDKQLYLRKANNKGFIDNVTLSGLSGFYAEILYEKPVIENFVHRTEYEYKTLDGNKAKELYRALTGAAKTEGKITDSRNLDYDAINCRFMIKLSSGQYYFCGRFRIQKRSGFEYISAKTGALHDDTVLYEIKDAEDFVYDRAAQIIGLQPQ